MGLKVTETGKRTLLRVRRFFAKPNRAILAAVVLVFIIGVLIYFIQNHDQQTVSDTQQPSTNPVVQTYRNKLPDLKQATQKDPNNSAAHNAYAEALYVTGDKKFAAQEYELAIQHDPKNATVHNNLGNTYRDLENFQKAEQSYRAAIQNAPADQKAYLNLANMQLYNQRDASAAITTYKAALSALGAPNEIKILLGLAYEQNNQLSEARATYQGVLAAQPSNQTAKNNLERINR